MQRIGKALLERITLLPGRRSGVRHPRARVAVATLSATVRPEDPRDVQPLAAFLEERAHSMPEVVVHLAGVVEGELLAITVDALEFTQAGDDVRFKIHRSVARGADEAGRHCADALD